MIVSAKSKTNIATVLENYTTSSVAGGVAWVWGFCGGTIWCIDDSSDD